ncbi:MULTISPECIES: 2-oxo-4-hydroxy-4-carboxy-5-ureidoimidazoline decarboxylase [Thiomicrorhabdus]|uniref:2-oxo-4-hydroxy-4-carboxy-5-ureidoimidazoline decarboxylase n=1 Tax=Thiomicrorhabdus heinhorstiae TaxID=2748010 RepID=A0ABS0C2H6_9GAMM|nr:MULTISPECIES: 2-oxo-4-hydroxy-4-carboxy-5-ureidoimidazoline decarboxylase [Thiomicrorhabdus]MBF6058487.1 2-oxo-4-hydroxy-4-carboxy-5-ureidoimidazoline decarboxylase [Thiomicrorhabdus heinhorstiae]
MTLDELNQLDESEFVDFCKDLLEHCEWVLPTLASRRPFASVSEIQFALQQLLLSASMEQQKVALCEHPKLGVSQAQPGFSSSEQQQAGLNELSAEEMELFAQLNLAYEDKMGFPFVVAVSGMNKEQILRLMQQRLGFSTDDEWPIALRELIKIAKLRVEKLIQS